ncbi:Protein peanut [Frankliniella fusca]|uniref:Protein peanut n=1 Tax=Frankliniella fusca TaxID=407009 RepID=A0AAE1HDF3_9NEOP|nr:Protein peanut [Frankliniella fusca]
MRLRKEGSGSVGSWPRSSPEVDGGSGRGFGSGSGSGRWRRLSERVARACRPPRMGLGRLAGRASMGCLGPSRPGPASPLAGSVSAPGTPTYYRPASLPIYAPRPPRLSPSPPAPAPDSTPVSAAAPAPAARPDPPPPPSTPLPLPLRVGTIRTEPSVQEEIQVFLQSKREQFFKNEPTTPTMPGPTPGSGSAPSVPPPTAPAPSAIKEALAKRAAERGRLQNGDSVNSEDNKERYNKENKAPERRTKELDGYVGFANLPNQVYRKAVKRGFDFTLMVVGESGLGKSTLINSMFLSDVYSNEHPGPSLRVKKTVAVETSKCLLKENNVNLSLTVVDTPGFGDAVDNSNCWAPVVEYIESKYEEFLNAESRVNRKILSDSRVHCCLYFIAPSGHGLKPLDVEFMQRLHDKVNIIPVIAKADTMTPDECNQFKKQILNEIAQHKIKIYEFPDTEEEEEVKQHKALKDRVPFAVVGSNTVIEVDGKKLRGRKYPWGIAEVENLEHCDFIALRNMLIRTHLQDLKEVTNSVHYENYRCRKLAGLGTDGKPGRISNNVAPQGVMNSFMTVWNPLAQMEEEKRDHDAKMKKMETEMEQVFEMKVKEKKQKLRDSEADLQRRHEQMKKSLEQQLRDLEEKRAAFDKERLTWEQQNGVTLQELRRRSLEANSKE